jgi:hypothetical protein
MAKLRGQCAEVITVKASHAEGYGQPWANMRGTPYACSDQSGRRQTLKLVAAAQSRTD